MYGFLELGRFKMTDMSIKFLSELLMWVRILTIEMHYHKINLILGGMSDLKKLGPYRFLATDYNQLFS